MVVEVYESPDQKARRLALRHVAYRIEAEIIGRNARGQNNVTQVLYDLPLIDKGPDPRLAVPADAIANALRVITDTVTYDDKPAYLAAVGNARIIGVTEDQLEAAFHAGLGTPSFDREPRAETYEVRVRASGETISGADGAHRTWHQALDALVRLAPHGADLMTVYTIARVHAS